MFMLLVAAVGAHAARATPAAGTEGRAGVAASTTTVISTTPQAGTEGRGGVAAVQVTTLAGEPTVAENGFVSRGRGGFPAGPAGVDRALAVSSAASTSAGWVAAGIVAAVALTAGFFIWAAGRRRAGQQQSSLASYCASHPSDSVCGTT